MQRLRPGLQGSLIPFAPPAFVPQRQSLPSSLPSPLVFLLISTDFTPTLGIPATHISDSSQLVSMAVPELSPGISPLTQLAAYIPFTPNDSEQRSHPTYYRGCWHVISRCFLCRYSHLSDISSEIILPCRKSFTTRRPSSLTRGRSVRLSPIAEYSQLLPPVGVWAVSQSQCGRLPSQVGYLSSPWWAITPPTS